MIERIIPIFLAVVLILFTVLTMYNQVIEYKNSKDPTLLQLKKKLRSFFDDRNADSTPWLIERLQNHKENNENIMDFVKLYKNDSSYCINKKKIYLCMTHKNDPSKYYSENMLMYVLAHELSHVLCPSIGHTDEFYEIFRILLSEFEKGGLYNPSLPTVHNYCK